jgi:hypothetical protein
MTPEISWLRTFSSRAVWLVALAAGWLLAAPAGAFPVIFDGPSGYGLSSETAGGALDAGFAHLTPGAINTALSAHLVIPDPQVLNAVISGSPSPSSPSTATSLWTVQNDGSHALLDAWLVFLKPINYDPSVIGIDLQSGQWAIVEVSVGSGESSTEYFYPAARLGNIAAGGSAQFEMHHRVATALLQQGTTLVLPKYGVGVLGAVPGPAALPLVGMMLFGLVLRRGSAA